MRIQNEIIAHGVGLCSLEKNNVGRPNYVCTTVHLTAVLINNS